MAGEFRGWLIPNSSLSSAVSNFQRISSLLVGPFVCWKRRSFSSIVQPRSGRSLRFNCLGVFSIGRFFATHGERLFITTGRGRGKILVAHVGERPCRGRSSKVLISRFDPGVKWAQFNCHKSSELHHVAIWSICWSQAKTIFSPDRNRYHEKSQSVNHASCYSPDCDQSVPCQEFAPGHGANAGPGFEKRAVDPGKIGESWQLNAKVPDFFTFVYRCSWLHMLQIDVPCSALLCASYRLTWIDWGWGSRGMCLIGIEIPKDLWSSIITQNQVVMFQNWSNSLCSWVHWIYTLLDPAMLAII